MSGTGRVVLVTGGSSGIGKAAAVILARKGWKVYAAARRVEAMEDLIGLGVNPIKLDVTHEIQCSAVVEEIMRREGRIDALVNNAGYGCYGALEDVPDREARRQFDVNVFGLMSLTRLVLPHMRRQKHGRIINIGSIAGRISIPMGGWYHATKFALEALSDSLRTEVKPFGIDVVLIQPGMVSSEFVGIAKENLLAVSGAGPYSELAGAMVSSMEAIAGQGNGAIAAASSDTIAKLIEHALQTDRPKTRYAAPFHAQFSLFFRWLLPDRVFDWIIMKQLTWMTRPGKK